MNKFLLGGRGELGRFLLPLRLANQCGPKPREDASWGENPVDDAVTTNSFPVRVGHETGSFFKAPKLKAEVALNRLGLGRPLRTLTMTTLAQQERFAQELAILANDQAAFNAMTETLGDDALDNLATLFGFATQDRRKVARERYAITPLAEVA